MGKPRTFVVVRKGMQIAQGTGEELQERWLKGDFDANDLLWSPGMKTTVPIAQVLKGEPPQQSAEPDTNLTVQQPSTTEAIIQIIPVSQPPSQSPEREKAQPGRAKKSQGGQRSLAGKIDKNEMGLRVFESPPRLWSPAILALFCFPLTVVVAGFVAAENWDELNETNRAWTDRVWSVFTLLLGIAAAVLDFIDLKEVALWVAVAAATIVPALWILISLREQVAYVKKKWKNDYLSNGWVAISITGLIIGTLLIWGERTVVSNSPLIRPKEKHTTYLGMRKGKWLTSESDDFFTFCQKIETDQFAKSFDRARKYLFFLPRSDLAEKTVATNLCNCILVNAEPRWTYAEFLAKVPGEQIIPNELQSVCLKKEILSGKAIPLPPQAAEPQQE